MNMYRTVLSALLLTPIIGGMGVKMIQGYQSAAKAAEDFVTESEKQTEETNALLDEIFDETSDPDINTDILSEDMDVDNIQDDDMITDESEKLQQITGL